MPFAKARASAAVPAVGVGNGAGALAKLGLGTGAEIIQGGFGVPGSCRLGTRRTATIAAAMSKIRNATQTTPYVSPRMESRRLTAGIPILHVN